LVLKLESLIHYLQSLHLISCGLKFKAIGKKISSTELIRAYLVNQSLIKMTEISLEKNIS